LSFNLCELIIYTLCWSLACWWCSHMGHVTTNQVLLYIFKVYTLGYHTMQMGSLLIML